MKVRVITYGCSANQADSELMMGLLEQAGHEVVNDSPEAYLINTCTVKNHTEHRIKNLLKSLKGSRVIVAGCMTNANQELRSDFPEFTFIGVNDVYKVVTALEAGESSLSNEKVVKLSSCKKRLKPLIEILPISEGCLGHCTYCKTKQAKGDLKSYPKDLIIRQAEEALNDGVKELWITSQDCSSYGLDAGTNLVTLINELIKLPYDFRVRLGMMNPNTALKLTGLPDLFKCDKVYKFIHVPVQSGSDKVLKDMGREYAVSDFKKLINSVREVDNKISVATDIICAYPTESEADWGRTIELIQWLKPFKINISRFYPRPGTKASYLKKLNDRITLARSRELTKLYNEIKSREKHDFKELWVNEVKSDRVLSRSPYYKQIRIE